MNGWNNWRRPYRAGSNEHPIAGTEVGRGGRRIRLVGPGPADTSAEQWERIGSLLRSLDGPRFAPWKSYTDVVEWLKQIRPAALVGCPDPVLSASMQLDAEAAGEPVPDWLWNMRNLSDEELQAIMGEQRP